MMAFSDQPLRLAIIGGGFTGAALAIYAAKASVRPLSIEMIEPAARLGYGAAYGASDQAHRINVPSDRMSLFREDPTHFTRWLFDHGRLPDRESTDEFGRHYVPRSAFGDYVADSLNCVLARSRFVVEMRRRRAKAIALRRETSIWRIDLSDGVSLTADAVALCTGHSAGAPCPISAGALRHRGLVLNPWAPGALDRIQRRDRVLIVGTGLTMADVVATLDRAGHEGPIKAVSRHGLLPRRHGLFVDLDLLDGEAPPQTALELLRLIRRRVRQCPGKADWQSVVDALRVRLPEIWPALPAAERRRAARRLLPFWEVHRFRISPQAAVSIERALARKSLTIERAGLISLDSRHGALDANLRMRGGASIWRAYDSIILCVGPAKDLRADPLFANLLDRGLARMDEVGLGLDVDPLGRVRDGEGDPQRGLFAIGPMTRGSFGEMTGAPDIVRHIERVIGKLISAESAPRGKARDSREIDVGVTSLRFP